MQCILALLQCGPADDTDIRALCEWKASPQINSVDSDKQQYADTVLIYALRTMSAEQIEALIFGPERGLIARARSIGCVEQLFQVDNEGCTPLMHGALMLSYLLLVDGCLPSSILTLFVCSVSPIEAARLSHSTLCSI